MSVFGLILLLLFLYLVVWPLLKIVLRINAARRQFNDMMNGTGTDARSSSRGRTGERNSRSRSSRRKKIPDDMGEYVAFEDIKCDVSDRAGRKRVTFEHEQQIEDAEWEDVKK